MEVRRRHVTKLAILTGDAMVSTAMTGGLVSMRQKEAWKNLRMEAWVVVIGYP